MDHLLAWVVAIILFYPLLVIIFMVWGACMGIIDGIAARLRYRKSNRKKAHHVK